MRSRLDGGLSDSLSEETDLEATVSQLDSLAETVMTGGQGGTSHTSTDPLPKQSGRFAVLGILGEGAFGRVSRARDPKLSRDVALKVPTAGAQMTDEATKRFFREGRAAAALRHPGICPVFDLGDEGDGQGPG